MADPIKKKNGGQQALEDVGALASGLAKVPLSIGTDVLTNIGAGAATMGANAANWANKGLGAVTGYRVPGIAEGAIEGTAKTPGNLDAIATAGGKIATGLGLEKVPQQKTGLTATPPPAPVVAQPVPSINQVMSQANADAQKMKTPLPGVGDPAQTQTIDVPAPAPQAETPQVGGSVNTVHFADTPTKQYGTQIIYGANGKPLKYQSVELTPENSLNGKHISEYGPDSLASMAAIANAKRQQGETAYQQGQLAIDAPYKEGLTANQRYATEEGAKSRVEVAKEAADARKYAADQKALYDPTKAEKATIDAAARTEAQKLQGKALLMSKPEFQALDDAQQTAMLEKYTMDPNTEEWLPGSPGVPESGSLWWKTPAKPATPGRRTPKVAAPPGMTNAGTSGGKPVYRDAQGNLHW